MLSYACQSLSSLLYFVYGDPYAAVEMLLNIMRGEGVAKGRVFPIRIPLGTDSFDSLRASDKEVLQICDEWGDMVKSTDFEHDNSVTTEVLLYTIQHMSITASA